MSETYIPTDTEQEIADAIEEGREGEPGRADLEDARARATQPPEDMIAYVEDMEDMGW